LKRPKRAFHAPPLRVVHILAALDTFKDSMTAEAACAAVCEGAAEASSGSAACAVAPLSDGGEGFARILAGAAGGELRRVRARGPRGEAVEAPVGRVEAAALPPAARERLGLAAGSLAILEMASVAGLEQVPASKRHPAHCSTHGVGELILEAAGAGAILLGIGGSATSDLGLGALEVLGLRFLDASGEPVAPLRPADWPRVATVEGRPRTDLPPILVACDVDNPLLGGRGAAAVYGPQKGLGPAEVEDYDRQAGRLAALLCQALGRPAELADAPGAGAAGGMGFGLMAACGARLVPGFPLVMDWLQLPAKIDAADVVVTGEGRFDASSLSGKGPCAVMEAASARGKRVLLLAGSVDPEAAEEARRRFPGARVECINPPDLPLERALREGPANLRRGSARCLAEILTS
jgi:glycerate kinase